MGYIPKTISGLKWIGLLRGFTRGFGFVRIAILARLLTPEQFGIFGIAALVLGLLEILTEIGINVFIVQEEKALTNYLNTIWSVSILKGLIVGGVILFSGPYVANFFKAPTVVSVISLMALVPVIRGFTNPSIFKFQKHLEFSKDFWFRITIEITSTIVAVTIALITRSVSSLAWGLIAGASAEVLLSHLFIRPSPRLALNKLRLRKIISRGKWLTLGGLLNFASVQGAEAVVGKMLGTATLGFYQLASRTAISPITEITDVFGKVTFPVYVKIRGDASRVKLAFFKNLGVVLSLVIPISLLLFLFPKTIVNILLGSNWLEVAPLLPELAIYSVLRILTTVTAPVILAYKQQKYLTVISVVKFAVTAIAIIPLTVIFGTIGVIHALLLSALVALPLSWLILYKIAFRPSK